MERKVFFYFNQISFSSFQHQMSLHRNATEFAERVRSAPISGNIDNPEGGLDALMQESYKYFVINTTSRSK